MKPHEPTTNASRNTAQTKYIPNLNKPNKSKTQFQIETIQSKAKPNLYLSKKLENNDRNHEEKKEKKELKDGGKQNRVSPI